MTDRPLNGSPEWDAVADADFGSDSHRRPMCLFCAVVFSIALLAAGYVVYLTACDLAAALR